MKKCLILSIFLVAVSISQAQTALENSWITNGRVQKIVTGDDKVLLMGEFDWYGPAYYGGTMSFSNTLVEDESFPKIEDEVLTSIPDEAGGWYVAAKDRANSQGKILHIHADKTIDELVALSGGIRTLAKSGNTLYFGGYFQTVNGTTRNDAAAINLTNNTLTSWNPNVDANGYINALAVSGTTVYAGGFFSNIGGQARTHVAALDATTGLATSWSVNLTGGSFIEVNCILVNAGVVYIGGYFDNVNAAAPSRRNFAAVNATTAALETFNPRPDGRVLTLLIDGGMLYMAGGFDQVYNTVRFRVARIELATSTLTPFEVIFLSNAHSNYFGYDQVYTIGIDGNKLFIGGTFTLVNGEQQPNLAEVDKITGLLTPSNKKINGVVNTLLVNGGNIFVGGNITGHLGTSVNGIAVLDETGTGLPAWINNIPPPPTDEYYLDYDFHYQDGRMYYYLNVSDGTTHLGALDADDGSVISSWSVTINHPIGGWAFSDDALYLADEGNGAMTINGQSRNRFAAVNLTTGALLPFTINFPLALSDHTVTSMELQNNTLYVAGEFSFTANGEDRNSFTAFNATTGALLSWSPPFDEIYNPKIVAITNSYIYVFGSEGLKRVHPVTGAVDNWDPVESGTVAVHNNSIFVGGGFSPGLVHLDGTTGQLATWQPDLIDVESGEGSVLALAVAGGKLLVGGNFNYVIGDIERYGYAEYLLPVFTNSSPVIEAVHRSALHQGSVSIYLPDIVTDVDDNLDLSTAQIISQPSSGAIASISDGYLIIDYSSLSFSGADNLTLSVCDTEGACAEEGITIELGEDILVFNAISANGDTDNDRMRIENIEAFANNKVTIYNRWGDAVFEISNYNNTDRVFTGVNNSGKDLAPGTYFYKIEFTGGRKVKTGFLSLKR